MNTFATSPVVEKQAQPAIVLDFNVGIVSKEVAVMPAELAKRLLIMLANNLSETSTSSIIDNLIDELRANRKDMSMAIKLATTFVQERELIANVLNGNWNAYSTVADSEEFKNNEVTIG